MSETLDLLLPDWRWHIQQAVSKQILATNPKSGFGLVIKHSFPVVCHFPSSLDLQCYTCISVWTQMTSNSGGKKLVGTEEVQSFVCGHFKVLFYCQFVLLIIIKAACYFAIKILNHACSYSQMVYEKYIESWIFPHRVGVQRNVQLQSY